MAARATSIVLLPRFTTLAGAATFATVPLDASRFESISLQVWRGDLRGTSPTFQAYLEESLDGEAWSLGAATPAGFDPGAGAAKSLSYCFQLRWFRLRVVLAGTDPMVTCWAEGRLR